MQRHRAGCVLVELRFADAVLDLAETAIQFVRAFAPRCCAVGGKGDYAMPLVGLSNS